VNRLDDAGNYFFIHIDKRANPEVFGQVKAAFTGRKNVVMLKRHVTPWGRIGCVRAMLEGIFALVEIGIKFDYAINLSGQDYPIKSNAKLFKCWKPIQTSHTFATTRFRIPVMHGLKKCSFIVIITLERVILSSRKWICSQPPGWMVCGTL